MLTTTLTVYGLRSNSILRIFDASELAKVKRGQLVTYPNTASCIPLTVTRGLRNTGS
jgi:hypothetical protein